jgi:tRNA nucleotidyltransferase (CCA-adding enzyme)
MVGTRLAKKIMRRLRFPSREVKKVENLVQYHMYPLHEEITKKTIRRWLNRMEPENFRDFLRVRLADRHGNRRTGKGFEPGFYRTVRLLREIEKSREAFSMRDLAVNGKDLMKAGIQPGPGMGRILEGLLERVLDEPGLNQKNILIRLAKEIEAEEGKTFS